MSGRAGDPAGGAPRHRGASSFPPSSLIFQRPSLHVWLIVLCAVECSPHWNRPISLPCPSLCGYILACRVLWAEKAPLENSF